MVTSVGKVAVEWLPLLARWRQLSYPYWKVTVSQLLLFTVGKVTLAQLKPLAR